jgi:hypothetical protein
MNINLVPAFGWEMRRDWSKAFREEPQGLKPSTCFVAFAARLKRLRKNSRIQVNQEENIPQGLKPDIYFVAFTARLKSCPDAYGGSG